MSFMRPTTTSFDTPSSLLQSGYNNSSDSVVMRRSSDFRSNLNDPKRLSLNFNPMSAEKSRHDGLMENTMDTQLVQLERDTLELRRELQDAIANKKASESKILA